MSKETFIKTTLLTGETQLSPYSEKNAELKIRIADHSNEYAKIDKVEGSVDNGVENTVLIENIWTSSKGEAADKALAEKDAEIAALKAQLDESKALAEKDAKIAGKKADK